MEAGYRLLVPTQAGLLGVKPLAGLSYNDLHRAGFAETGGFGLAFAGQTFGRATSLVGLALGLDALPESWARLRPDIRLGWTHDLVQAAPFATAFLLDQPFRARDARAGRDGLLVETTLSLWSSDRVSLFVGYRGEYRARAASNQGHAGLRVTW
ncbi:outer membrane autotransporter protein [Methylobacterium sp. BE186]|nr:outer membrane autotransporter protein [Methylobacterium sp. BE186]